MSSVFPPSCAARFRHVAELARGGYGTVHRAVQVALERRVVVKLLHASTSEPEQLARFAAEARVTASLADPHIVVVLDHDVSGGIPWIAYEELPGPDVRALLDAGVPPLSEATRIASHVASALAAAHARGVLHRDIKPENVLGAGPGVYKVTDFGIAKWAGAGVATADGVILGTPAYLSPEVCEGKAARPASDVYALGVMLHELLAGTRPFAQDGVMELMTAHVREAPPRLDGAPPALADLVSRMLAKAPLQRPSLDEVRALLAPFHGEAAPAPRKRPSARTTVPAGSRPSHPLTKPSETAAPPRRPGPLIAGALAVTLVAAIALARRLPPAPVAPPPSPAATATPATRPPRMITLQEVQRLVIPIPSTEVVRRWEKTRAIWPLARYALDCREEFGDAETLVGTTRPEEGGAQGDELADRTVLCQQIAFRRILQDRVDGKRQGALELPPWRESFTREAERSPAYARCGRLHGFLAQLAFLQADTGAAVASGLRALGLAPVGEGQYVRQTFVTAELAHAIGLAARLGGTPLTPDAGLHLMKLAHEACPTNVGYAADYARDLASVDYAGAERVLDRAGPLDNNFWTIDARYHVAFHCGRIARARRALEAMAAAPRLPRDTDHLASDRLTLSAEGPDRLSRVPPLERLVELETEWAWVRGEPKLIEAIRWLAQSTPSLEAALVAQDLAPLRADRVRMLEQAAIQAGALRTAARLAAKAGVKETPVGLLGPEITRRALQVEIYRQEPPDAVTRTVAAQAAELVPLDCDPLFERLLKIGSPGADLLAQAARVSRYHQRHDEALARAEGALKLVPGHYLATLEFGHELIRQGRSAEVLAHTRPLRGRADLPLDLVSQIAEVETDAGVPDEAVLFLRPFIERDEKEGSGWVLRYRLAQALIKQGKMDEAEAELARVEKKQPDFPPTLEARARIAAKRGHLDEADALFRKALVRGDSPWISQSYDSFKRSRNRK